MVIDTRTKLLTPSEVAALFWVDPRTVTRWAVAGRIETVRTPGGHRRFAADSVHALLTELAPRANPGRRNGARLLEESGRPRDEARVASQAVTPRAQSRQGDFPTASPRRTRVVRRDEAEAIISRVLARLDT